MTEGVVTGVSTGMDTGVVTGAGPSTSTSTSTSTDASTGTGVVTSTGPSTSGSTSGSSGAVVDTSTGAGSTGADLSTGTSGGSTGPVDNSTGSSGQACPPNSPPAAPTVLEPLAGRIDIIPDTLKIISSPFVDPDPGDVLGTVEAEIWRVKKGVVTERVWHAEVVDGTLPTLMLADGVFDMAPLTEWTDYVIRLRYSDDHGACSSFSPWGPDRLFRTDDGSTKLFDETVVRDFYLDIPPDSWTALDSQALPPGCVPFERKYYTGTLRFEGQTYPGVGIKTKGGCGSSRKMSGKPSFKVNLEWDDQVIPGCPPPRKILGEHHFTFNNGVQDTSATRERLTYPLYREVGLPAPRAASVRLFVNNQLWGLYTHVETIDRRFLSRWYGSNDGMLYEGTYWCDLLPINIGVTDTDDSKCLTREFSPDVCTVPDPGADPLDYKPLRDLINAIQALPPNGFYPEIEAIVNFDRYLTMWAFESLVAHWDNHTFKIKNNYRVYHDISTMRWTFISTGIDQVLKQNTDPWGVDAILSKRCLQEKDCENAFAARLNQLKNNYINLNLPTRAETIFQQIKPYVQADPKKEYSYNTFLNEHTTLLNNIGMRPAQIINYLAAHGY